MPRYILAIIPKDGKIAAVICRRKFSGFGVENIFYQEMPELDNPRDHLLDLKKQCLANGFARAWKNCALVCLPPQAALFHDFQLPPANMGMAKKSLRLLLDSEFPFNPDDFEIKTSFCHNKNPRQLNALATLLPKKTLAQWQDALNACGLDSARIYAAPWPLISCLPPLKSQSLLLYIMRGQSALCALDERGRPLRIHQLEILASGEEGNGDFQAKQIWNQCQLFLAGLPFSPQTLLVYGDNLARPMLKELQLAFSLPVKMPGNDFPLAGEHSRLEETESARLLAICMAAHSSRIIRARDAASFSLRLLNRQSGKYLDKAWIPLSAAALLMFCTGTSYFLEGMDKKTQAANLRQTMLRETHSALKNAPKNAGMGRLLAILNSRIIELEKGMRQENPHPVSRILEEIHKAAPPALNVDIHRFSIDNSGARLYGQAGSFDDVNELRERLGSINGMADSRIVNAANSAGKRQGEKNRVVFELNLTRGHE